MSITARELLDSNPIFKDAEGEYVCFDYMDDIEKIMIEFARIKSQEVLEIASEKVYFITERDSYRNIRSVTIKKESILNAYPPENIK